MVKKMPNWEDEGVPEQFYKVYNTKDWRELERKIQKMRKMYENIMAMAEQEGLHVRFVDKKTTKVEIKKDGIMYTGEEQED